MSTGTDRDSPRRTRAGFYRWASLAIGEIASLAWGFALATRFFTLRGSRSIEDIALILLVAVNVIAFFVAHEDGRWGAIVAIWAAAAFGLFAFATADGSQVVAALLAGGPFLAAAVFYLMAAREERSSWPTPRHQSLTGGTPSTDG
jgi:uncharacterized membrane protein HdeD (DUF308 family)